MNDIELGGIFRCVPMDPGSPAALVLVTAIDEAAQCLGVTLLSPDIEFGTSADLLLSRQDTGLAYALLAESDVFGYAWIVQLDRKLGRVDAPVLDAISALRDEEPVGHPIAGPPAVQQSDPRWSFKLQELKRLQSLTAHCTRELIDGERIPSIDPNALRAPLTEAEVTAFEEFVVDVVGSVKRGAARVPGWLVDIALDEELVRAYRAVGLYNSLRLLWKLADTTDVPTPPVARGGAASLAGFFEFQVERSLSAGYSNLWLMARSTDIRGPVEARAIRAPDGRLVQVSLVAANAHVASHREVHA